MFNDAEKEDELFYSSKNGNNLFFNAVLLQIDF